MGIQFTYNYVIYIPDSPFFRCYLDKDVKGNKPWTFNVMVKGCDFYPLSLDRKYAYASKEMADAACKEFSDTIAFDAFLVCKNADFIEGNGPMLPHKLFRQFNEAEEWIKKQEGVYGSPQNKSIQFGLDIKNEYFCIVSYNGYQIKPINYEKV